MIFTRHGKVSQEKMILPVSLPSSISPPSSSVKVTLPPPRLEIDLPFGSPARNSTYLPLPHGRPLQGIYFTLGRPARVVIDIGFDRLSQNPYCLSTQRQKYNTFEIDRSCAIEISHVNAESEIKDLFRQKKNCDFFILDAPEKEVQYFLDKSIQSKELHPKLRVSSIVDNTGGLVEKLTLLYKQTPVILVQGKTYGDVLDPHIASYFRVSAP